MAQPQDFAGFGPARFETYSTTYALEWTLNYEESTARAERDASELSARGFREGIKRHFSGRQEGPRKYRDAVSSAIVFVAVSGAQQELATTVAFDLKRLGNPDLHRFAVQSIPGSIGIEERRPNDVGDNVAFSIGRCYFSIGDGIHEGSTAHHVAHSASSAAIAVDNRAKHACA